MTLIDAANIAERVLENRLAPLGLSCPQQQLLERLLAAKGPLTASMLASLLLHETHTVSGLLNRLEARGLITRAESKEDRRTVFVSLTPAGREAAAKGRRVVQKALRELGADLGGRYAEDVLDAVTLMRYIGFKVAGIRMDMRREALRRSKGLPPLATQNFSYATSFRSALGWPADFRVFAK